MQILNLENWDARNNKRTREPYLVARASDGNSYQVKDPRYFDIIKGSTIINAEVFVDTGADGTVYYTITHAEQVQAGALPQKEKNQWQGGGGGGRRGGGDYKADPQKQAYIIRQSGLDRGFTTAIWLAEHSYLAPKDGQTMGQAILAAALGIAGKCEEWVRQAQPTVDRTPDTPSVVTPPQPVAQPQPAPVQIPVPQPVKAGAPDDDEFPF